MTEVVNCQPAHEPSDGPSDAELINLVRAGDADAYEELFRRHRDVAIRYARRISDRERAEDLCAEAFTKILDLLRRGKGPDVAFRAYLLTTVRTSHLNALRSLNREDLVPDHEPIGRMIPVIEDSDARFDQHAILRAFAQLPERWQAALWLTSVEGLGHDEVSEHLGIKANAVASLAFRARAGLRQAFLAEHLLETKDPNCRVVVEQLPAYFGDRLSPRRRHKIDEHLQGCRPCSSAALELSDVDNRLRALLVPLGLAGLTATKVGGATVLPTALVGLLGGAKALGTRLPRLLGTHASAAAAVAAVVVGGALVLHDALPGHVAPTSASPSLADAAVAEMPRLRVTHVVPALARVATPAPARPTSAPSVAATRQPAAPAAPVHPHRTPTHPVASHPAAPASSAPATPTPTPTPTDPVSTPPATPALFGTPTVTSTQPTRIQVLLPVQGATTGTTLTISSTDAFLLNPHEGTSGWECSPPDRTRSADGNGVDSVATCTYTADGDGSPLELEFLVDPGATMSATLTATDGAVSDTVELALTS